MSSRWYSVSPVSAISRIRAARSLPIPGISLRPAASSEARWWGWFAAISAPLRYARILKGLSLLISRRSAISPRIRAIAKLSNPKAFRFDAIVEHPRPAAGKRFPNRFAAVRRTVAEQTASTTCTAHLGAGGAGGDRARNQLLDHRCGYPGCEPLAILPFLGNLPSDPVPVCLLQAGPHRRRGVANALETVEHIAIAVEVTLDDF